MNGYVDYTSLAQIIGCVFNEPDLLDITDTYTMREEDFPDEFLKIIFGTIYQLHLVNSDVTLDSMLDFLSNRPKYEAIFNTNKGIEYITEAAKLATRDTFNYYYNRMKKFTLLRTYDENGIDVKDLYDPYNIIDTNKKQEQEEWLDETSLIDIAKIIDEKVEGIKLSCVREDLYEGYQAGEDVINLIEDLEKNPEVGAPLYGRLINSVTRGARLRKIYVRSAATGIG